MKSIEMGRETLKYIGKTAKGTIAIGGEFQRTVGYVFPSDKSVKTILYLSELLFPMNAKFLGGGSGRLAEIRRATLACMDVAPYIAIGVLARDGLYWQAAVAKFGYNLIAQVASDVAKLARKKVF